MSRSTRKRQEHSDEQVSPECQNQGHRNRRVASVEIDNPAQRNALTRDMCLELQELMPRLEADPAVTVVALRGAGSTFCPGAAINELSAVLLDQQEADNNVDQLSRADQAITSVTKPTVAMVDGDCMGGGWQIASACDAIIASERSAFAITPAKIGILDPRPGTERLVPQVGHANAKFIPPHRPGLHRSPSPGPRFGGRGLSRR